MDTFNQFNIIDGLVLIFFSKYSLVNDLMRLFVKARRVKIEDYRSVTKTKYFKGLINYFSSSLLIISLQ